MAGPVAREVFGTLAAAALVVLAAQHACAIRWLGLHLQTVEWNTTSAAACGAARASQQLTRRQARLCRSSPDTMAQVVRAALLTTAACQQLLADRRWNCSSVLRAPRFTPELTTGTREQAFVYALSSAAVTHVVARACAAGLLPQCSCAGPPREPPDGHFKWGGCGDNLRWAAGFARLFVDAVEKHRPAPGAGLRANLTRVRRERSAMALVNLHNNRAGRRAVEASVESQCKCHGVSGSCSVRTCWRALPARLVQVGERLVRQYPRAVAVRPSDLPAGPRLLPANPSHLSHTLPRLSRDDLIYLTNSPDYCHRDFQVGSVGTYGRKCNSSSEGYSSCVNMCCGRGYVTQTVEKVERCQCKYYWCCYVKCKSCRTWVQVNQCN